MDDNLIYGQLLLILMTTLKVLTCVCTVRVWVRVHVCVLCILRKAHNSCVFLTFPTTITLRQLNTTGSLFTLSPKNCVNDLINFSSH